MAPVSWNGSQIIYNKVVRPVFLRHEATVDNMVSSLGGKAMAAAENLTREGTCLQGWGSLSRQPPADVSSLSSLNHPDEEQSSGDPSSRAQPDPDQEFTQFIS